jgi:hypothetical protein
MKAGDMIETESGHTGIIIGIEMLYPGHPHSPPRNVEVLWNDEQPQYAWRVDKNISTVSAFSIKQVRRV